jgi:hypothetical protein
MAEDKFTLVYLEDRPIALMEMKHYLKQGILQLKSHGQEFFVSERERKFLLKMKNGTEPIFREKEEQNVSR